MGSKHQSSRSSSSSSSPSICFSNRFSTILTVTILFTSLYLFISPIKHGSEPLARTIMETGFNGDLRDANFPWNSLCFGNNFEKLKLAVFSKTWPIGAAPGGMERHAATLYHALAAKGHEIHVFTVPSDRMPHIDIHQGNLHVYFAANDHGSVNCSLAFEIFNTINANGQFDYVHTESVSLPHWRAKMVPHVAVTWHGICVAGVDKISCITHVHPHKNLQKLGIDPPLMPPSALAVSSDDSSLPPPSALTFTSQQYSQILELLNKTQVPVAPASLTLPIAYPPNSRFVQLPNGSLQWQDEGDW
ncbi:hypothetical protein GOBAR_AA13656 [Gossypium barbadense]|uniref:Glycosyltransferase subfamily 4-like N-terminal domain-containing protein n=1 Tax=Gossypium barbadense TaxID=3634 RepID=A0A2P5XUG2_GOSBA|nr:hypothetical protein GOBAR_AA13656 [Gossypium barbadense]